MKAVLEVLKKHRAVAVGFVNEGKLYKDKETEKKIKILKS